jgi:DNA-binding IclR family transcriptional regulator
MIKVIDKVFDILEMLAEQPAQARGLGEIASRMKFHPATCANIMKSLVARHYVEQVAPKKGYLIGPAVYRLVGRGAYRQDLVAVVKPFLAGLAKDVNETVLLTVLRNGQRFVLFQVDGRQAVQINNDLLFQNRTYATATGRLLLSGLDKTELDNAFEQIGAPGDEWPAVRSFGDLKKSLSRINKQGWLCTPLDGDAVGVAFPLYQPAGHMVAAIGIFLPSYRFKGRHKRKIMTGMKETAEAITRALATA